MMSALARFAGPTHALLRIVAGLLFIPHGAQKLFGVLGGMGGSGTAAAFPDLMWIAGFVEFFGGLFVALGLFTRPAALLCSGQMLVAYFKAHAPQGGLPLQNHGELALLYCFVFLFFAASGAGPWSIDSARRKPM